MMTCDTARNRILALAGPTGLPVELAGHVADCLDCRSWQTLLSQVDLALAAEPVPASSGRAKRRLMADFSAAAPTVPQTILTLEAPRPTRKLVVPAADRTPIGERLAKLWPLGLVAAGLLAAVVGYTSLTAPSDDTITIVDSGDPLLEKSVRAKVKLDSATKAGDKIAILDTLAQDIHEQARTVSKVTPGADMDSLARMYQMVVSESMIAQAGYLTEAEKRDLLPKYVDSLREAERVANRMAAEAPVGSERPLREMAKAAQGSGNLLAQMMQQGRAS